MRGMRKNIARIKCIRRDIMLAPGDCFVDEFGQLSEEGSAALIENRVFTKRSILCVGSGIRSINRVFDLEIEATDHRPKSQVISAIPVESLGTISADEWAGG
jgi:hypothetical protein